MTLALRALGATLSFPLAERYSGRDIWKKKSELDAWQRESAAQKQLRATEALCATVEYAGQNVPYYRDLFKRIRFEPSRLRKDPQYLQDIPYLTKETILAQPDQFLSSQFRKADIIERKTSGSTGLTLSFYYSRSDLDWASAVIFHLNAALSRSLADSEVHLAFVDPTAEPAGLLDGFRAGLRAMAMNRKTINIRTLSAEAAASHLAEIRARKPYLLYGLQSTLRALIQFAGSPDQYRRLAKYFVSSGETLDARAAEFIAEATGAQVINRYGNAEFGAVAQSSVDPQVLRFVDGLVWPENLVIQGYPEIVMTTLIGRAMPLIRYRTGDLGLVAADDEGGGSVLSGIQGRLHEIVEIGGRSFTTSFLATYLHARFSIHDFQVVVGPKGPPEFRIVTDMPAQLPAMEAALAALCCAPVKVTRIRPTDLIRRGRQMKFSHYVRDADATGAGA
jgi:phenylacetate-CoA ligase